MNPELLENPEIFGVDMMLLDVLAWLGTVSQSRLTDRCLTGTACQIHSVCAYVCICAVGTRWFHCERT